MECDGLARREDYEGEGDTERERRTLFKDTIILYSNRER